MIPTTRTAVLALCQQIDGNGCYTDERASVEGFGPLDHQDALHALAALHSREHAGSDPYSRSIYLECLLAAESIR